MAAGAAALGMALWLAQAAYADPPIPPASASAPPSKPSERAAFVWHRPVFTHMDSLFLVAATGEPRFQKQRDSSEKSLVADTATPGYLLSRRLTGQTPRQRHYVEHLFTAISDSGRNHAPVTKLAAALPGAADSVKAQLLYIGSELGDSAFLPVARLYLPADSEEVRKAAARSLGTYPKAQDTPWLLDRIGKTEGLERQENLWALSHHARVKDWPRLLPWLQDGNLYNRQLVRRLLDSACSGDWTRLASHVPAQPTQSERLEWMLLALEMRGPAAKGYIGKELPKLDPISRKFIESSLPVPAQSPPSAR